MTMTNQNESQRIETVYNFDSVNMQIELELEKQREKLRLERASVWNRFATAFAIIVLATGGAYLLYAISEHFLRKPLSGGSRAISAINASLPEDIRTSTQVNNTVSVGFTVFRTESILDGRRVITGYKYEPDQTDFPVSQYCYIAKSITDVVENSTHVAKVFGKGFPTWHLDLNEEDSKLARQLCRFMTD